VQIAPILLVLAGVYLGVGAVHAVPFLIRGMERIDPAARAAPWSFRMLIAPGVVALWPLLLRRWLRAARGAARP